MAFRRPRLPSSRSSRPLAGATIEAETTEAETMGATVAETITAATAETAVPADTGYIATRRRLRDRVLPSAARTRIIGWAPLLVFTALGLVTFVTWRLLIAATDARMGQDLRFEIQQFTELATPGVNPRTGAPFTDVDEVIREAIAYSVAKPNEKFLGYVEGQFRSQSRQQPDQQDVLARDAAFTELVGPLRPRRRPLPAPRYRRGGVCRRTRDAIGGSGPRRDRRGVPGRRQTGRRRRGCSTHADSRRRDPAGSDWCRVVGGGRTCIHCVTSPRQRARSPTPTCPDASRGGVATATKSGTSWLPSTDARSRRDRRGCAATVHR